MTATSTARNPIGGESGVLTAEFALGPMQGLVLRTGFHKGSSASIKVLLQSAGAQDQTAAGGESAEVLGCDIKPDVWHVIPCGRSATIYTHSGCTLAVQATPQVLQQVSVVPQSSVFIRAAVELHYSLEESRVAAKKALDAGDDAAIGPRVLVCSARPSCGKSSLVQVLANYAVRLRYHPVVVDLDVDCPSCGAYPETVAAHCLQYPIDLTEGYALAPSGLQFVYGSSDYSQNVPLMNELCRSLSDAVLSRQSRFPRSRIGGLFVDYPTLDTQAIMEAEEQHFGAGAGVGEDGTAHVRPNPLDQLIATADTFDIDTIIVIGSDWLKMKLQRTCTERYGKDRPAEGSAAGDDGTALGSYHQHVDDGRVVLPSGATARCFSFPSADTAMTRTAPVRDALRRQHWMTYFFGTGTSPVAPVLVQLDLSKVRFATVGGIVAETMQGLLPMEDKLYGAGGAGSSFLTRRVQEVTAADVKLTGRVVAVSDASSVKILPSGVEEPLSYDAFYAEVGRLEVGGFVLVRDVTATSVTILAPNSGLPLHRVGLTCLLLMDTFLAVK